MRTITRCLIQAICVAAVLPASSVASARPATACKGGVDPNLSTPFTVVADSGDCEQPEDCTWRVESATLVLPPGHCIEWHNHPVPAFAYILEGEWSIANPLCTTTYGAGQVLTAVSGEVHRDENNGTVNAKALVHRFMLKGVPFRVPVAPPPTQHAGDATCVNEPPIQ